MKKTKTKLLRSWIVTRYHVPGTSRCITQHASNTSDGHHKVDSQNLCFRSKNVGGWAANGSAWNQGSWNAMASLRNTDDGSLSYNDSNYFLYDMTYSIKYYSCLSLGLLLIHWKRIVNIWKCSATHIWRLQHSECMRECRINKRTNEWVNDFIWIHISVSKKT